MTKRLWEDEDDADFKPMLQGRAPQWLQKYEEDKLAEANEETRSNDSEDDDAVVALHGMSRTAVKYLSKSKFLPRMYLKTNQIPNITKAHAHQSQLGDLKFHPTQPVLLLASRQGISLFQVCKSTTDLQSKKRGDAFLQNVLFKQFSIDYMSFYNDASSVLATSKQSPNYYTYDMLSGHVNQHIYPRAVKEGIRRNQGNLVRLSNDGSLMAIVSRLLEVHVYSFKTMDFIHTFMANSNISDFCFSPTDEKKLFALTVTGMCHIWDLRETQEQHVFQDEASFHGTVLNVSPSEQFVACGSNTGIVNVYETLTAQLQTNPKPTYTLGNLTTSVDFLQFNHNSEILSFGSSDKQMAYRMLHTQSGTVFKNFPTKQEMFGRGFFTCTDFSPHSGFAAFGNKTGDVKLYRLSHYKNY